MLHQAPHFLRPTPDPPLPPTPSQWARLVIKQTKQGQRRNVNNEDNNKARTFLHFRSSFVNTALMLANVHASRLLISRQICGFLEDFVTGFVLFVTTLLPAKCLLSTQDYLCFCSGHKKLVAAPKSMSRVCNNRSFQFLAHSVLSQSLHERILKNLHKTK